MLTNQPSGTIDRWACFLKDFPVHLYRHCLS